MAESSLATLYEQRERLQLGNTFTMVGNLHNAASGYGTGCSPSPHKTDFTRVLTWNVGGGSGTLRDRDKLVFLTSTMLQQHVHIACGGKQLHSDTAQAAHDPSRPKAEVAGPKIGGR